MIGNAATAHTASAQVYYQILGHLQGRYGGFKQPLKCSNTFLKITDIYEGHLESKERFAIKKYLLKIGKKKNMKVLSHTFTFFST